MSKIYFLIIHILFINLSYAQLRSLGKPRRLTKLEIRKDEINKNCIHKIKYSPTQRLKIYPFNIASQIQLISFEPPDSIVDGGEIPMKKNSIDYSQLIEVVRLNTVQINSLTDILYNTGYGGIFFSYQEIKCYNPRNAILFLNKAGKTFAFIELCFQCHGNKLSSNKVKPGEFCNQKYDLLKEYFFKIGIKHGTRELTQ